MQQRIERVACVERTTLISGPTGSGKELVAKALHDGSPRSDRPLVTIHCGALPETLVESELFGHTKGAFTGATSNREGLLATAHGGTLFLDEVNSLSLSAQCKLLRFLESGEFRAVGTDCPRSSDVWVLAATNRDLESCVSDRTFREDLLYRLDVLRIDVPSLASRADDIPVLARHFLKVVAPEKRLSAAAEGALRRHPWPGNVRELKHRVESAALFSGPVVEPRDLALEHAAPLTMDAVDLESQLWSLVTDQGCSLPEAMTHCERLLVHAALEAERNNRTRAAQRLGIHVRTIFKKLAH